MRHTLLILGSGQDGGSPQVGTPAAASPARSAASMAIITDDGAVLLFDASPDLRLQYQHLANHCGGAPELDGVFITHCHMGHYAGLLHFGKEAASSDGLPLFAPTSVLTFLDENEPWSSLFTNGNLLPITMDDATATIGDITVSGIPVPHRAEYTDTVGYSIAVQGDPWVFYLPDIDGWDEWPAAHDVIAAHDVSLIDATFSSHEELPERDITAIRHPLVPDTIDRFAELARSHTIVLTHINHSNPLGMEGAGITSSARDAGFIIAYDGLVIDHD